MNVDHKQGQRIMELVAGGVDPDEAIAKVVGAKTPIKAQVRKVVDGTPHVVHEDDPPKKKPSKYGNVRCEEDGYTFDSMKERARYRELKYALNAGLISDLELQPVYHFEHNGVKIGKYTPDFRYVRNGAVVVEDVKAASKAARSRDYILRKKMLKAFHGIEVQEV